MNDQPTPDALSRASAYLDGELDAAEIATAEADPDVMAEVARLRDLQAAVRDVAAPTSGARDAAIAAALAEYDRKRHPSPVVHTRPRPGYSRWLAVAAAVAGVAVLGTVIATAGRGGGDNDTAQELGVAADASAEDTSLASAAFDTEAADRSAAGGAAPAAPQAEAAITQPMIASASTEAPAATESASGDASAAESASSAEASATTAAASATDSSAPAPFDPNTPIPDELELGRIGRQLLAEWTAGLRDSKVGTPCDAAIPDVVLLSDGMLIVDGVARTVLIAGNPTDSQVLAIAPDTCVVVATGR